MPQDELTTAEAAQKLRVSERTVRRMIERGAIHAEKMDPTSKSVYRIPGTEIERILKARTKSQDQSSKSN
jgi:excisionase family DNA binding protein